MTNYGISVKPPSRRRGRGVFELKSSAAKPRRIWAKYSDAEPRQGGFTVYTPSSASDWSVETCANQWKANLQIWSASECADQWEANLMNSTKPRQFACQFGSQFWIITVRLYPWEEYINLTIIIASLVLNFSIFQQKPSMRALVSVVGFSQRFLGWSSLSLCLSHYLFALR